MKVLIIGFGSIGKRHYDVLGSIVGIEQVSVVTKQDLIGINVYHNISEVDDLCLYDYIVIANETYKHLETLKYLDANVTGKKILCEKPLFDIFYDVSFTNNFVYVGYVLRYHPLFTLLSEVLYNQRVLSVNVFCGAYLPTWRPNTDYRNCYSASKAKGGGVILDLSHEIDYVMWLFGEIIESKSICSKISDLEIDSDDVAIIIGRTTKNVLVNIQIDYITKLARRSILINTNDLTILVDLIANSLVVTNKSGKVIKSEECKQLARNDLFVGMHESIINESSVNCSLEQGLKVMKLIANVKKENNL